MIPAKHAAECADIATSSDEYARRFSGDTGKWLIQVQSNIVREMLNQISVSSALDVGGGHGQLASLYIDQGITPHILGSNQSCSKQIKHLLDDKKCIFNEGSLDNLPYPAKSFELVSCIRFISHCQNWKHLITELTRVADKYVLIDYPPLISSNIASPLAFHIKKMIEGNTRPFSIFTNHEIIGQFNINNFKLLHKQGQFLLPMALHRLMKNRQISDSIESSKMLEYLRRNFGSPILALFERIK